MKLSDLTQSRPDDQPVPPELLAAIERGLADARAGRSVDGQAALRDFRALATRLKAERDGKAGQ